MNAPKTIQRRRRTPARLAAIVYYPQTEGHLHSRELEAEFEKLGRNDPIWQALIQLLQRRLAQATVAAVDHEANAPGRIEELLDLQRELMALRGTSEVATNAPRIGPNRHQGGRRR